MAVDTTLVSALHCDGSARRGAAVRDGVALAEARRCKERTSPEFVQPGRRARLVVVAGEVGRRWSREAIAFIRHLAKACARGEPAILRRDVEQAWRLRWCSRVQLHGRSQVPSWNGGLREVQTVTRQVSTTCSTIADSLGWSWLREPASDGCRDSRCTCHWLINFPLFFQKKKKRQSSNIVKSRASPSSLMRRSHCIKKLGVALRRAPRRARRSSCEMIVEVCAD